jgi:hypothetical protein
MKAVLLQSLLGQFLNDTAREAYHSKRWLDFLARKG